VDAPADALAEYAERLAEAKNLQDEEVHKLVSLLSHAPVTRRQPEAPGVDPTSTSPAVLPL